MSGRASGKLGFGTAEPSLHTEQFCARVEATAKNAMVRRRRSLIFIVKDAAEIGRETKVHVSDADA